MAFNLIRWLVEALNPCIHEWELVEPLKDDEQNPSTVTYVRQCALCRELSTLTIQAPTKPPEHLHHWQTIRRRAVYPGTLGGADGSAPFAFDHEQQCIECGELRCVRL